MNLSRRAELFDVLAELRSRYPDWRFGQLVSNVAGWTDRDVWDVEDDQLIAAAKQHLQRQSDQEQEARIR
jgi:hypothetical protein